jgi:RNA-directed DNA polymerase
VNIGASWPGLIEAKPRVLEMQRKLHHWAKADPGRRFDDLYNLVADPAFLTVAWSRVRGNKGARTAGIDGVKPRSVGAGAEKLLRGLREDLKARRFRPRRTREKMIPKAGGKVRCRPMRSRWGGGPVVVRAGESPVHGEGVQRVRSFNADRGGRW